MIEQPAATLCRCAQPLDLCADCRAWLIAESPRIAGSWRSWLLHAWPGRWPLSTRQANAAESDDLAFFLSWRYSRND